MDKRWKKNLGLSVVELLIILTAIGIVVLVAVPGSTVVLDKHRMRVASESIMMGLELARSEAIARSTAVVLCPSSNGHTCRNDGEWNHGWLVYSDGNGNGTVQDIELIQAFEAPSQKIRIKADGAVQMRAAFSATGLIKDNDADSGKLLICLPNSKTLTTIVVVDADGWVQKIPNRLETCTTG